MTDWVQIANQLGIPVAVMVIMGVAIWRFGRAAFSWAGPRIDDALKSYQSTNAQHAASAQKSAEALGQLVPICEASKVMIEKIDDGHENTAKKVDEIHTIVKELKEKRG